MFVNQQSLVEAGNDEIKIKVGKKLRKKTEINRKNIEKPSTKKIPGQSCLHKNQRVAYNSQGLQRALQQIDEACTYKPSVEQSTEHNLTDKTQKRGQHQGKGREEKPKDQQEGNQVDLRSTIYIIFFNFIACYCFVKFFILM